MQMLKTVHIAEKNTVKDFINIHVFLLGPCLSEKCSLDLGLEEGFLPKVFML